LSKASQRRVSIVLNTALTSPKQIGNFFSRQADGLSSGHIAKEIVVPPQFASNLAKKQNSDGRKLVEDRLPALGIEACDHTISSSDKLVVLAVIREDLVFTDMVASEETYRRTTVTMEINLPIDNDDAARRISLDV
jgi:hypothetical protein